MRITELTAYHAYIPLKKTIRHASHSRTANDTLIVRCELSDGTVGWGEGLPRFYVTGETIETAFQQFRQTDWAGRLGADCDGLSDAVQLLGDIPLAAAPGDARDCFGNTVRCAVELAVLDAFARVDGVPLSKVTELVPEAQNLRRPQNEVRYSGVITSMSPLKQTVSAIKMMLFGFRQVKVKVGTEGIDDSASLRRIRRIVGQKVDLRVDANEAWTCESIESQVQPLRRFNITSVEQPVPHDCVAGLAKVRGQLGVPIMLDESLCSLGDASRAIEQGTCDLFNIRLSKCGGFINSLKLAAMAHGAGLGFQLGCQVGETGILSAAGRHFACSVDRIRYLEGSYDRFLLKDRVTVEDLTFRHGGRAPALTGPGLGVSIDQTVLKRMTLDQESCRIHR